MKDIQRYDAHHDPITLNYMAAGCKYPCDFNVYIVLIMCRARIDVILVLHFNWMEKWYEP